MEDGIVKIGSYPSPEATGFMAMIKRTFLDTDGSLCLPELGAIAHGATGLVGFVVMLAAFIRQTWIKDQTPDYASLSAAISMLFASAAIMVAALGKAMQWRDGQPIKGDHDADEH